MIRVLICEDDFRVANVHESLVGQFSSFKCVGKATNVQTMMDQINEQDIDLILLDLYLPDGLGVEQIMNVKAAAPNVDIIVITASDERDHVQQAIRYGVYDYIIKSHSFERLEQSLANYVSYFNLMNRSAPFDQEHIDQLLERSLKPESSDFSDLPKGIDGMTLQHVQQLLKAMAEGVTAEEMGENLGASRTTARRYLEYLIQLERAVAMPVYGVVGRPERKYFLK
ncbi:response regulator [Geomicrobium sp. JCM 19055]|uniref:response regulator n=1 Tax=Geomicrobium sp. JCM 19055 TaxID=1460649 RepID=UPI00045ECC67|nr:response regulator [Geomicrobium sp. JCM 19055]GAK01232.1 transcriptional regulatory protein CitB, DpiA [Geomicrobium sp. JCM 19055]